MTGPQTTYYWRLWRECCRANGWRMERARLLYDPAKLNEVGKKVFAVAEQLAAQSHRAALLDDLRHGCHYVALGRARSSRDLTNPEFNRVRLTFQLCADFDNLQAQMGQANPALAEQRSYAAFLRKHANEATLRALARNAFDAPDWSGLPLGKLRWIARQVKFRTPSRKQFWRQRLATVERHTSGRECDPANAEGKNLEQI